MPRHFLVLIVCLNIGLVAFLFLQLRPRTILPGANQVAVWDPSTGLAVPGARALRRHPSERAEIPGPASLAGTFIPADERGFITLTPRDMKEGVFVGAPGYAWEWLGDWILKESLCVASLKPGGSVRLRIPRFREMLDPELVFRDPRSNSIRGHVLPDPGLEGEVLLDGLPAGAQVLELRRREVAGDPEVYGSVSVQIPAGGQVAATLEWDPASLTPARRVRGTVTFPAGWPGPRTTLELQPAEPDIGLEAESFYVNVPPGGGCIPFRTPRLAPGSYHLSIHPGWTTVVVVPEAGVTKEIVLPELATGIVRLVDAESGEPVTEARVTWNPEEVEMRTHSLEPTEATGKPGEFRFRTASSCVVVHVESAHHRLTSRTTMDLASGDDPSGGPAPRVLSLSRAGEIRVAFRCGREPASPEKLVVSRPRPRSESGWVSGTTTVSNGAAAMGGLEPGPYNVGVETGPAYEAVPDRVIEVVAGRTMEITIDLVKRTAAPANSGSR